MPLMPGGLSSGALRNLGWQFRQVTLAPGWAACDGQHPGSRARVTRARARRARARALKPGPQDPVLRTIAALQGHHGVHGRGNSKPERDRTSKLNLSAADDE